MCQTAEFPRMLTGQWFGFAKSTWSATGDHVAFGFRLQLRNKFVPGLALSNQSITSSLPAVSSSPLVRRIFGNRVLWQRQSQISLKWICATSRMSEERGYDARSENQMRSPRVSPHDQSQASASILFRQHWETTSRLSASIACDDPICSVKQSAPKIPSKRSVLS
jgi:hypothetical protein